MLFRRKAEITCKSSGDAAAGSRGKTKFFPDLFRAPGGAQYGCSVTLVLAGAKPTNQDKEKSLLLGGFFFQLRSVAQRGSAVCQRRHAAAPLVQRGDSMATPCRGDCEAGGMIQLVFYCRVREHRLGAAARRQSLSRRSPTAPFAQGRSGGRTAILSLPWLVVLAWAKRV